MPPVRPAVTACFELLEHQLKSQSALLGARGARDTWTHSSTRMQPHTPSASLARLPLLFTPVEGEIEMLIISWNVAGWARSLKHIRFDLLRQRGRLSQVRRVRASL